MEKETSKEENELKNIRELMKACDKRGQPNAKARRELKQLVKGSQACKDIMRQREGLYGISLKTRIENMPASDLFKELTLFKCELLQEELGYSSANPLEKMAIELIVLSWIDLHQTQMDYANVMAQTDDSDTGIYWEKRLTFSSRRYTRATEALVKMRKMNLTIQVNNAINQIITSKD